MVPKVVGFWQREDFNLSILAKQFCFTPASSYLWIFFFLEIIWNILRNLILQPTKNFIAFLLFNSPIWNFLSFFIHSSLAMRKSGLITLNSYLCMSQGFPSGQAFQGDTLAVTSMWSEVYWKYASFFLPHLSKRKVLGGENPYLSDMICLSKNSPDSWLINNSLRMHSLWPNCLIPNLQY